jgi:hypothetical protein
MDKRPLSIEWYMAESDADWARWCAPAILDSSPGKTPAAGSRLSAQHFLGALAAILLLVGAGDWWWCTAQVELHQAKAEGRTAVPQDRQEVMLGDDSLTTSLNVDPATSNVWSQVAQVERSRRAVVQLTASTAHLDGAVSRIEVQGDQAVVNLVMPAKREVPAYRQTRFYQRMAEDWQQTAPNAALWGPERSLETPSFVFHFRQHDASAVTAAAPQIEALYTTLKGNFGWASPTGAEKLVVQVSVTQTPADTLAWYRLPEPLRVPSPAVYRAPVEVTDAALLEESITLPLVNYVLAQASERHAIGAAWQPLVKGLRLWQVWDLDLPLASWRADIVKWVYIDLPTNQAGQSFVLPEHYTALCAAHQLWMPSPLQLHIPLVCADLDWEEWYWASWDARTPLTHLDQLAVPVRSNAESMIQRSILERLNQPSQPVALATLIEYTVATYGRERLPNLVAGLGHYDSWDTLLRVVYGVSPDEFEAGWQAYLATHYGAVSAR